MKAHARKRRWLRAVTALACVVVFCTTYALILPAVTLTEETFCGLEEHTHTQECYEHVLACGYDEDSDGAEDAEEAEETGEPDTPQSEESEETEEAHRHTDACYETETILVCDAEEGDGHTHDESCFEEQETLICTEEESRQEESDDADAEEPSSTGHVHTDACYEERLICGLEEHTHSLSCYSDPTADVETASVWERTLPDEPGDDWKENLIAVAESQLGYAESERNYEVGEDHTLRGYTRYGDWYGRTYGDWAAVFASFCLHYAGIPKAAVPQEADCAAWTDTLSAAGLYQSAPDAAAEAGSLIFFDTDGDALADHVGIVTGVTAAEDGTAVLETVEGDVDGAVAAGRYDAADSDILGYAFLPENTGEYAEDPPQEETEGTDPASAAGKEDALTTLTAVIYTDADCTQLAEDETVITLTGVLPEGAHVTAYAKELELEQLVCAYDITIVREDGTAFEPDADHPISVCIQLPDEQTDARQELTACYVADDGAVEPLSTQCLEDGVCFEAEHFSTYAVMAASTTSVGTLRALRNAFNNAASGDVIRLTGNITIGNTTNLPLSVNGKNLTLDLNGYHITYNNVNATLFQVQSGRLTIRDTGSSSSGKSFQYSVMTSAVTDDATGETAESTESCTVTTNGYIQGSSAALVTVSGGTFTLESGLLCEGTGRAVDQSGGTVNLKGGYVNGFTKTSSAINSNDGFGGAVRLTAGTLNLSGTVLCNNQAPNGGAIYNHGGTLNITGGVISGNTSTRTTTNWNNHSESSTYRCGGGGIYADNGSVTNISGGYVTCNSTTDTGYFDGGGGIFLSGSNTALNVSGGYITGNTAAGGGGIRTSFGSSTIVTMTGGFLSGNTATNAEGGGANLDRGCTATITGGYVTNNTLKKGEHWGGGGLFCADGATLYLKNGLITNNTGDGFGSGIGGCSTGKLYLYVNDGCAIYNNTATGKNYATGGAKEDGDRSRVAKYPEFLNHGYQDFFCALKSTVTGTMLGDSAANWEGTADGTAVSMEKDDYATAAELMGLSAHPNEEAVARAQSLATLYINGNYSVTHGAGVMCNGNLIVGTPADIVRPVTLSVTGTKQLLLDGNAQSLEGKTFSFQITDESGTVLSTGTSASDGTISFAPALQFSEAGSFVCLISEVTPENADPAITYDSVCYRLSVTVSRDGGTTLYGDSKAYNCSLSSAKLEVSRDGGTTWQSVSGTVQNGVVTLPSTDGASFTNTQRDIVQLKVDKRWMNGSEASAPGADSVEIILKKDGAELERVTLSAENHWSHTWEALENHHAYTVEEVAVDGYTAAYASKTEGILTTVTVTNTLTQTYALPETGGSGTTPFLIGGALLMAGSLLLGYQNDKKRKKGTYE